MKYPELVPDRVCKTDCQVIIHGEGLTEDGAPIEKGPFAVKCNYQDKAKTIYTKEQKVVKISGSAYFNGDIAPDIPVISGGRFTVFGVDREILQGTKARNPDGTVNYTLLEVI